MSIKRVYVAGPLKPTGLWSKTPNIDYLANVRHMIRLGVDVILAGFVPFIPALDNQMFLQLREGEYITEAMIKRYSKDWLEVCDAVLLTIGWQKSLGTAAEIKLAEVLQIPIFENLEELIEYNKGT
jgi:hypothetical protein